MARPPSSFFCHSMDLRVYNPAGTSWTGLKCRISRPISAILPLWQVISSELQTTTEP